MDTPSILRHAYCVSLALHETRSILDGQPDPHAGFHVLESATSACVNTSLSALHSHMEHASFLTQYSLLQFLEVELAKTSTSAKQKGAQLVHRAGVMRAEKQGMHASSMHWGFTFMSGPGCWGW